jgi:hypothetical protein
MNMQPKKPSWIPPLIALIAILLSLITFAIPDLRYSSAIYFAYILTPFIPILALAFVRSSDTKARSNVFYDLAKGKKIVSTSVALSIIGFLVALPVIYLIAEVRSGI